MKAIDTLKAVAVVSLALSAFHYAIVSEVDTMVAAGAAGDSAAGQAEPAGLVMEARTPQAETSPDIAFGTPDPDFGKPSPATGGAAAAPPESDDTAALEAGLPAETDR